MRILWVSNAPESRSGYGGQTRQVGRRLRDAGHEVIFAANDGHRGVARWGQGQLGPDDRGAIVLGMGNDRYARDVVREHIGRFSVDWAISLYDAWVYVEGGRKDPFHGLRVAGWFPVDHQPVPSVVADWARTHTPIAMSRFGQSQLAEAGIRAHYVPHALEPVFHPTSVSPGYGGSFRAALKVPDDAFVVSIVAANIAGRLFDRKGWSEMIQGLAPFMRRHRDVYLYLHTLEMGVEGIPLPFLLRRCDVPSDRIRWVDQWAAKMGMIGDDDMAAIHSAANVLLLTSRGEGFGIPAIEAQACGVPVIVSDWTAQAELVGAPWSDDPERRGLREHPSGWSVSVQRIYDMTQDAWFGVPRIEEITDALEEAYRRRDDASLRDGALAKAAEYGADKVFEENWLPVLAEMEAEINAQRVTEVAKLSRRDRRAAAAIKRRKVA